MPLFYPGDPEAWFDAGVACVRMGSKLVRKDWIRAGDFKAIAERAQTTLQMNRLLRAAQP